MLSSVGSCLLGWQPLPINNGVRVPESTGYGNGKWSPTDEQPTVALTGDRLRADAPDSFLSTYSPKTRRQQFVCSLESGIPPDTWLNIQRSDVSYLSWETLPFES